MDRGTPSSEASDSGNHTTGDCSGSNPCEGSETPGGKVVELGRAFVKTVRHFWPGFNAQLNQLPDTRFAPFIRYHKKFLAWWGLLLFCFKLGSRRQLDYELSDPELWVLDNANRLADTEQHSLPVHKTLAHFLRHVGPEALAQLRTRCVRRLIRMKTLPGRGPERAGDPFRLSGHLVVAVGGASFLVFHKRHCEHCLTHPAVGGAAPLFISIPLWMPSSCHRAA